MTASGSKLQTKLDIQYFKHLFFLLFKSMFNVQQLYETYGPVTGYIHPINPWGKGALTPWSSSLDCPCPQDCVAYSLGQPLPAGLHGLMARANRAAHVCRALQPNSQSQDVLGLYSLLARLNKGTTWGKVTARVGECGPSLLHQVPVSEK